MYSFPAKSELGIDLLRNTNLIFDQYLYEVKILQRLCNNKN